jgi:hypothetical protein
MVAEAETVVEAKRRSEASSLAESEHDPVGGLVNVEPTMLGEA